MQNIEKKISDSTGIAISQIRAVDKLLADGSTIPFIARYRKEATGNLDEVDLARVHDHLNKARELEARREKILVRMEETENLTPSLEQKMRGAQTLCELEDLYLPFKSKRVTRAQKAKDSGYTPLAMLIFSQRGTDPLKEAASHIRTNNLKDTPEDVLSGARDIIAGMINEDPRARSSMRRLFETRAQLKSTLIRGKETEGEKFKNWFDHTERATSAPSHRILAMLRGEKLKCLKLSIRPADEDALALLERSFKKGNGKDSLEVQRAISDSWKRLLSKSIETEFRNSLREKAETDAINVFAENLKTLLLSPPLGPRRVMGIDPGFRTGCKIACLDRQGTFLGHDTIYPHGSDNQKTQAMETVIALCQKHDIEAIAVGNGTGGRETQAFVKTGKIKDIPVLLISESGASIYSASKTARDEFPHLDLTIRGAISIGRRLMDPLSELVKIDPKSIGVGQYQHDVDPAALKAKLKGVVEHCVNSVGVDLNLAGRELLSHVSGLGEKIAENIVLYRTANGPFERRTQLKKVPRLGPKAFEQSAGFLRIKSGKNILDASAVHPESYPIVMQMAKDLNCSLTDLTENPSLRSQINISDYTSESFGEPTLNDIIAELAKPGRDPRQSFKEILFTANIETVDDLEPGMTLPGIVTNVTAFGAFVDMGVHRDGLVHISEMADRFIKDPAELVSPGQEVRVRVKEIDPAGKRISLTMKGLDQ